MRIELTTSPLPRGRTAPVLHQQRSWRRDLNPQLPAYRAGALPVELRQHGGPDRDRTDCLLGANQALSQMSYRPVVESGGIEPPFRDCQSRVLPLDDDPELPPLVGRGPRRSSPFDCGTSAASKADRSTSAQADAGRSRTTCTWLPPFVRGGSVTAGAPSSWQSVVIRRWLSARRRSSCRSRSSSCRASP